ncbi:hypothetical protein [Pyrococcus yayanosii]|uniref:Uncharacterized protein n=1 Tax=Pyrococcus yayanosii (strain CH1 / JCM 16557) TaxID=529709 RepID=F8AGF0_PYRYC|nr:hypothetical protein [Pyrococcus yayanosii]AEH25146.1 hypothetical protein PYCH_14760 [Pyrococcus yayanosii CH1]
MTLKEWELNEPTRLMILLAGMILNTFILHSAYLHLTASYTILHSQSLTSFPSILGAHIIRVISGLLSNGSFWIISGLFISLLGSVIFRMDRDVGYANSIYSLPYKKWEIFGIKYLVLLLYSLTLTFIPFFSVSIIASLSLIEYIPDILFSKMVVYRILLSLYMILYLTSLVSLVSLISPNILITIIISLSLFFLPFFISISEVPPLLFIIGNFKEALNFKMITWGVIVPLALIILSMGISEWKDVR